MQRTKPPNRARVRVLSWFVVDISAAEAEVPPPPRILERPLVHSLTRSLAVMSTTLVKYYTITTTAHHIPPQRQHILFADETFHTETTRKGLEVSVLNEDHKNNTSIGPTARYSAAVATLKTWYGQSRGHERRARRWCQSSHS